jgi:hypothetical protein
MHVITAYSNFARKGSIMNSLAWIGIIAWGLVVTGFGLVSATPPLEQAGGLANELAAHDVIFLVSGGLLTCLIGIVGLLGFMGWIPGLQKARLQSGLQSEQKSCA